MRGIRNGSSIAAFLAALAFFALSAFTATGAGATVISGKHGPAKPRLAPKPTTTATFTARGSIDSAYASGTTPGIKLLLVNNKNRVLNEGRSDSFGSKVFYGLNPGAGFRIFTVKGKVVAASKRFAVLRAGKNPPNSFYEGKTLNEGLNYVTMRDGTELAMTVRLPSGKDLSDGPFPTFVEYSGYQTAAPHDAFASFVTNTSDSLAPATSTAVGSIVGPLLNFATVSVQMRGTGCSGGAFDLFGLPTTYDGYDAIETVGNQPWVKGGKVGMVGGIRAVGPVASPADVGGHARWAIVHSLAGVVAGARRRHVARDPGRDLLCHRPEDQRQRVPVYHRRWAGPAGRGAPRHQGFLTAARYGHRAGGV